MLLKFLNSCNRAIEVDRTYVNGFDNRFGVTSLISKTNIGTYYIIKITIVFLGIERSLTLIVLMINKKVYYLLRTLYVSMTWESVIRRV